MWRTALSTNPFLHVQAPWYRPLTDNWDVVRWFADADGMLPGAIPLEAVKSWEWQQRCAVEDRDFARSRRVWRDGNWTNFQDGGNPWPSHLELLQHKVHHMVSKIPLDSSFGFDLWGSRNKAEVGYCRALHQAVGMVEGWSALGVNVDVHPDAILWECRLLPEDYRSQKKSKSGFWSDTVRFERRSRMLHNKFVLWHNIEVESLGPRRVSDKYISVPQWWSEWEVPQGFWAELPCVLAYKASFFLRNPMSAWWVIACTGWAVNVAVFLVWDAYDTSRLWFLPPKLVEALHILPLQGVLGEDGHRDLKKFLKVIEEVKWEQVPKVNNCRSSASRSRFCFGRNGQAGDFVWIDPVTAKIVSEGEAKARRAGAQAGPQPSAVPKWQGAPTSFKDVGVKRAQSSKVPSEDRAGQKDTGAVPTGSSTRDEIWELSSAESDSDDCLLPSPTKRAEILKAREEKNQRRRERGKRSQQQVPQEERAAKKPRTTSGSPEESSDKQSTSSPKGQDKTEKSPWDPKGAPVLFSKGATKVVLRFVECCIQEPAGGFANTVPDIISQLRCMVQSLQKEVEKGNPIDNPVGDWRVRADGNVLTPAAVAVVHQFLRELFTGLPRKLPGSINGLLSLFHRNFEGWCERAHQSAKLFPEGNPLSG